MSRSFEQVMEFTRGVSSATAFDDQECRSLWEMLQQVPTGGLVTEIGCQLGRTSSIILQVAPEIPFASAHIDPWSAQPQYAADWHRMAHSLGTPHQVWQMRTDQAHALWRAPIDLLLIDGDHTADGVRKDCRFARDFVRPGGVLCAHDFRRESLPDVAEVLEQFAVPPDWEILGVRGTLGIWRRRGGSPGGLA